MTVAFLSAIQALIFRVALVPGASIMPPLVALLGLFWIGNRLVLPRVPRNPFVGVRTAWTLSSPENWERTNRLASKAMCVGGVFGLVMGAWARRRASSRASAACSSRRSCRLPSRDVVPPEEGLAGR